VFFSARAGGGRKKRDTSSLETVSRTRPAYCGINEAQLLHVFADPVNPQTNILFAPFLPSALFSAGYPTNNDFFEETPGCERLIV
jgi:hypothetical protein